MLGDPLEPGTEMGPVANRRHFDSILGFVERAVAQGATLCTGGGPALEVGELFVKPTILTDVAADTEIVCEEVFDPVLAVSRFGTEQEAVALANSTRYGLAAGIWSKDVHRVHRVARQLRSGTVWANSYRVVAPSVPFGGWASGGWGRKRTVWKPSRRTPARKPYGSSSPEPPVTPSGWDDHDDDPRRRSDQAHLTQLRHR